MKGNFIYIFGIDGSGKTSLVYSLQEYLNRVTPGVCVAAVNHKPFTKELEKVAVSVHKNRRECFSPLLRGSVWGLDLINKAIDMIAPSINVGKTVIVDRYDICNKVYTYMNTHDIQIIDRIHVSLPKPDLYIYLDVDWKLAYERIISRGEPMSPKESLPRLQEALKLYEYFIKREQIDIVRLNANLSQEEVFNNCIQVLKESRRK